MDLICILFGYLFGSIPWALIIGKQFYHTDIRKHGSGNLGGTNAGRILGKKAGVAVKVLDALKALFVVMIVHYIYPSAAVISGCMCAIGHCFPIFANFKGGKAVATTMGYLLAVSIFITHTPIQLFVIPVLVFFGVLYLRKMVSLASICAVVSASVIGCFVTSDFYTALSIILLAIFVIYRHRENIERIKNGTEKKITWM